MADHRYRVIKRLEADGMTEVYLGEASSLEGFKKRVAIKRLLPHLARDENFIQMFLDEARLSARLSHAKHVAAWPTRMSCTMKTAARSASCIATSRHRTS